MALASTEIAPRSLRALKDELPPVSVIVGVYNEEKWIRRCLSTLLAQTYPTYEVIVVDDGSSDRTAAIAERFPVTVLRSVHRGVALARNFGADHATGEVLVFVDGDMAFSAQFLTRLVSPIVEGRAVGSFSAELYVANLDNVWALTWERCRGARRDPHAALELPQTWSIFRAIRADAFRRVGGFDNVGHGEDLTLYEKLKVEALAAPGAIFYHHSPSSLGEILENALWIGRGERIREIPQPLRYYSPLRAVGRGLRGALRYRSVHFFVVRVLHDLGIALGYLQSCHDRTRHYK